MSKNGVAPITNVVVLMLENRSFDNVLGTLYPRSDSFEGLPLDSKNYSSNGVAHRVNNNPDSTAVPPIDPGEAFADMNLQIFGNTDGTGEATMSGFVLDYLATSQEYPDIPTRPAFWYTDLPRTDPATGEHARAKEIMNYFTSSGDSPQMAVTGELAQAFAVTDSWFGSCPTQTFANRLFLTCASSGGFVDDYEYIEYILKEARIPNLPSIFERLDTLNPNTPSIQNWKVYFHDIPGSLFLIDYVFQALTSFSGNVCHFDNNKPEVEPLLTPTFLDDLKNETLPRFSLIEPMYANHPDNSPPLFANCNHPPNDVIYGEILLANVYNAIRASSYWQQGNILLVVTYDEHGGCYDHVPPPENATPPGGAELTPPDHYPYPYEFPGTRYGPRVPALLISPRVPAGTVFRPEGFTPVTPYTDVTPYDHTSVIATLNDFFQTGALTARDAAAPSFSHILSLSDDNLNPGPASVKVPTPPALPADGLAGLMNHPTAMAKKLSLLRELFRDEIKL